MGDFRKRVTYEDFMKKASENGWFPEGNEQTKLMSLYGISGQLEEADEFLDTIMKTDVWYKKDKDALVKKLDEVLAAGMRKGLFMPDFYFDMKRGYQFHDGSQKKLDEQYKKIYGKDRPKKPEEIEAEKAEAARKQREAEQEERNRQNQILEEEYRKKAPIRNANRKLFDKKYNDLEEEEFLKKASDNLWTLQSGKFSDNSGLREFYRAVRNSGDEELFKTFDMFLNTKIDSVETRNKVASAVNMTLQEAIKRQAVINDSMFSVKIVENIIALNDKATEKDFAKLVKDRNDREAAKKEAERFSKAQKIFLDKMCKIGWSAANYTERDYSALTDIFKVYDSTLKNGKSPLDPYMSILFNSKIRKNEQHYDKYETIKQFGDKVKESKLDEKIKDRIKKSVNLLINKYKNNRELAYYRINKDKIKALKENKEAGKKVFIDQMISNGWSKEDSEIFGKIFNAGFDKENGFNNLESAFQNLFQASVKDDDPVNSKREILGNFINDIKKFITYKNSDISDLAKELCDKYDKEAERIEAEKARKAEEKYVKEAQKNINSTASEINSAENKISKDEPVPDKRDRIMAKENQELVEKIKREATEMYNTINKVDFILFGQGSPQFRKMLADLKDLKDYANEHIRLEKNGTIRSDLLAQYFDKQKECIESVGKYVSHKAEDLTEKGRKNSWWKSLHEQPRINASLNVLESLKSSYALGRNAIITNMRELYMPKLDKMIENHDNVIKSQEITPENYYVSLAQTAEMIENRNPALWDLQTSPLEQESLANFVHRTEGYAQEYNYTLAPAHMYMSDTTAHNVYTKAEKILTDDVYEGTQYKPKTMLNSKQLKRVLIETCPNIKYKKVPHEYNPKDEIVEIKDEITGLKNGLLSDSQKAKDIAEKNQAKLKNNAPKI